MPHVHGFANGFDDLISKIIAWSTDVDIHGADAWELIRNEPWPRGTILKVHGFEAEEHFYIGLMSKAIEKNVTYKEWFLQKPVLASQFVWPTKGLNKPAMQFEINGMTITDIDAQPNVTYAFDGDLDIFAASAQALFLGAFKQYAPALDWHEQPGGMEHLSLPLRPIYYNYTGSNVKQAFVPPAFPGTGYPAIGMDFIGPLNGYLEYWMTKDAHRLILVTKNQEYWDVAYIGFLEPYHRGEYAFPATVIGGTSGAIIHGRDIVVSSSGVPSVATGIQFDYRPTNWALTHGVPAFAAGTADSRDTLSQVRLMLPDGRWQAFANWVQTETAYPNYSSAGKLTSYTYVRDKPQRPENLGCFLRPMESMTTGTAHVYRQQGELLTYQLEPLEFVQGNGQITNMLGRAWRIYWPSSRIAQYGEIMIDGKLHLMLPNAWENRRFSLSAGRSAGNDPDELFAEEVAIEAISRQMNCLVRLED